MPVIIAGLLSLMIWLYLLLARGGFWRARKMLPPPTEPLAAKKIAVIVPARNEADVIGQTITSLLNQTCGSSIHVFLVDDGSSDGTAQAAREAAERAGHAADLTVITGQPLPPGWSGKLWALQQGIERAREVAPDFFLLTDADIAHAPENVAILVSVAAADNYDLASFMVRLHCGTLAEKFLVPAFVFFFFMLYPPAWIRNPRRRTAGAAGGCILIRPEALERAGGINAIRGEIIDDCALARAVKSGGGRVWLGLTESAASVRPYLSFAEVGRMISRTAFKQLRHSSLLLLLSLAGLTVTYLLPPALLFSGPPLSIALGASAWLAMTAVYLPMVRFYRLNPLWALALPLVAVFYMGCTFHSAVRYWSGSGGFWKGRVQDPAK
ncbi:MAG: glycosyltransferase [Acidobacteriia bacterium]|nr:glycosyltransferase [Terriglobia bacterium]